MVPGCRGMWDVGGFACLVQLMDDRVARISRRATSSPGTPEARHHGTLPTPPKSLPTPLKPQPERELPRPRKPPLPVDAPVTRLIHRCRCAAELRCVRRVQDLESYLRGDAIQPEVLQKHQVQVLSELMPVARVGSLAGAELAGTRALERCCVEPPSARMVGRCDAVDVAAYCGERLVGLVRSLSSAEQSEVATRGSAAQAGCRRPSAHEAGDGRDGVQSAASTYQMPRLGPGPGILMMGARTRRWGESNVLVPYSAARS